MATATLAKNRVKNVPMDQILEDAYYGTGGFENGDYLIPHKREKDVKHEIRKEIAYYLNYVQPVVNSHVDPVFNNGITREYGNDDLFAGFLEDVDCDGNDMDNFMKQAGLSAKLKGMCAIVVDNFPAEEQPKNMAGVKEQRIYPYAFILEKDEIINYKLDKFGRLKEITYEEPTDSDSDGKNDKATKISWSETEWWRVDSTGKETDRQPHSVGRVPAVLLKSRKTKNRQIKVPSEFVSIAKANLRIYNLCSELDEILRNQAFAILTYPGGSGGDPKKGGTGSTEVITGTDNMLGYAPDATHSPAYIAPPAEPANMIMAQIDRLIKEIYRMAVLSFVTGVSESKTGIAKQWDFEKTNQVLADFAGNCEKVEVEIADIFSRWTGRKFTLTSEYSNDFGIDDITALLTEALQALELNAGPVFNKAVKLKVAHKYFSDLDEEKKNEIIKDIEQQKEDEAMVQATDAAGNKLPVKAKDTGGSQLDQDVTDDGSTAPKTV